MVKSEGQDTQVRRRFRVNELLGAIEDQVRRLGPGEHLQIERLLGQMFAHRVPVPRGELRAALASLLARSELEWNQIAVLVDRHVPRVGAGEAEECLAIAARSAPSEPVRRLSLGALFGGLLLLGLAVATIQFVVVGPVPQLSRDAGAVLDGGTHHEPAMQAVRWRKVPWQPGHATPPRRSVVRPWSIRDTVAFGLAVPLFALALRRLLIPWASRRRRLAARAAKAREREQARSGASEHALHRRQERLRLEQLLLDAGLSERLAYHVPRRLAVADNVADQAAAVLARLRSETPGEELDVAATIDQTIAAGGRAAPVFQVRPGPRPLLILVDMGHGGHPWLGGFERLLLRWQRQGLRFLRFDFRGNPDHLAPHPAGHGCMMFVDLARRHGGDPLVLFSPQPQLTATDAAGVAVAARWSELLDAFPVRVWIDPDPRPFARRPTARGVCRRLGRRGLVRFDLEEAHLTHLVRHLATEGRSGRGPQRRPLADQTHPDRAAVERALWTWAALCALVPDADWDQVEELRQRFPEVGEVLRERRDVALLLDWVAAQPEDRGGFDGQRDRLVLEPALEDRLIHGLRQMEAGMALQERIEFRGRALLVEQLRRAQPEHEYLLRRWEVRLWGHLMYLEPDQEQELLAALGGSPLQDEVRDMLHTALGTGAKEAGCWRPETVAAVKEYLGEAPAAAPEPLREGAEHWELWRGHGRLWVGAGLAAVALTAVLGGGGWWAADNAPLVQLFHVTEILPAPLDTQDVYEVVRNALPETAARPSMVLIPAGSFEMGSPDSEAGRDPDEKQHTVHIRRWFYLAETEITRRQYRTVMGKEPSQLACRDDCPVESVSWEEAVAYCNRLSALEQLEPCYAISDEQMSWKKGLGCGGYRLPTEAEWEYTARAGRRHLRYGDTDDASDVCRYSNVADQSFTERSKLADGLNGLGLKPFACADKYAELAPVKQFLANPFGLYDMNGNAVEWVWDWHQTDYETLSADDPTGPNTGASRVVRGGSWYSFQQDARMAGRSVGRPSRRDVSLGFRVAKSVP